MKGLEVSAVGINSTTLPTKSWYTTAANVTGGAKLNAEGDVLITSEEATNAKSDAQGTSIGFAVSADITKGENHIHTNNNITINAAIHAEGALTITTASNASMLARTIADGGGFFASGTLKAINELVRSSIITIEEETELSANFGDLTISSNVGEDDSIITYAKITSGGVVSLGDVETSLTLNNTAKVQVTGFKSITNRFGTVKVRSNASQNGVDTYGSADCSGLGVAPDVKNTAKIVLTSQVNISNPNGVIEGRYVYINSAIN